MEHHESETGNGSLTVHEVDIFLGQNYVAARQDHEVQALQAVWQACCRDSRHCQQEAEHLLYRSLDYLAADYFPLVARMDDAIDLLEEQIFPSPPRMC